MHTSAILVVEVILKGTAILLAGYGGAALLARSSAAHRSWWWLGVFVTLLLLPLAFLVRPLWILPVLAEVPAAVAPADLPVADSPRAVSSLEVPVVEATVADAPVVKTPRTDRPSGRAHFSPGPWMFGGYACGVFVVLGFRLLGAWQLRQLRRGSVGDPEAQALIDRWRQNSGMRRGVRVCCDARVTVPMTWGIGRPVILLPDHRGARTAGELQAALQHEFAHIRHHDAARRWLATIVAALWWPHPLVWLASRAWKLEQERACDDAVLTSGGDATSYAQQLLGAARGARLSGSQNAAALIMAAPAGLETRLRSVMNEKVDRSPTRRGALLRIGACTAAATLCGLAFQARSVGAAPTAATPPPSAATANEEAKAMQKKAEETIIPKFEYFEATPVVALQAISKAMGVRINYTPRPDDRANLSFSLTNVPAAEALKYVAHLAYLNFTYQPDGITFVALRVPVGGPGALEKKAQDIHLPKLVFKDATPAEVLKALSDASGIKAVYTPVDWDKPNQTFTYQEGAPAGSLFQDFSWRANLYMTWREDAVYFVANPYARNGFQTPGTVEYSAEMTAVPKIVWKGIKPAEAFQEITAASGIKIFYTPRPTDKPGLPETFNNASVAFLVEQVAYPAGLRISYESDGVHLAPGNPDLNAEHSAARWRQGLPRVSNPALEASPEFKAMAKQRLEENQAFWADKVIKKSLLKLGDPAPDFTCQTIAGEEFSLSKEKGKVVLISFTVPRGEPCLADNRRLEKEIFQPFGGRKDFKMIVIGRGAAADLAKYAKEKGLSLPIAPDPQKELYAKFATELSERSYVVGKDGKIKLLEGESVGMIPWEGKTVVGVNGYPEGTFPRMIETLQKELAANP